VPTASIYHGYASDLPGAGRDATPNRPGARQETVSAELVGRAQLRNAATEPDPVPPRLMCGARRLPCRVDHRHVDVVRGQAVRDLGAPGDDRLRSRVGQLERDPGEDLDIRPRRRPPLIATIAAITAAWRSAVGRTVSIPTCSNHSW
jgi:hypothetical protein